MKRSDIIIKYLSTYLDFLLVGTDVKLFIGSR